MLILLYILLSLLAVSLWINIGLWREVRRLENKVVDLCLEKMAKEALEEPERDFSEFMKELEDEK